jgi:hypothetical protein
MQPTSNVEKCWNWCCLKRQASADDILSGEEAHPSKNCFTQCFGNSGLTGFTGTTFGVSTTLWGVGIAASKMLGSAGIASVIGIGTPVWVTMVIVSAISGGTLTVSSVACCYPYCEKSGGRVNTTSLDSSSSAFLTGWTSENGVRIYAYEEDED